MKNSKFLLILLFILVLGSSTFAQKRIAVYVQNYSPTGTVQWNRMTHLVHAFLNPMDNTGNITNAAGVPVAPAAPSIWFDTGNFTTMIAAARAANPNIKIIISTGGAPAGDAGLQARLISIMGNAAARTEMANDLAAFVQQYNLDGWDFDWEHPMTVADKNNHQTFLSMMKTRLNALEATMCKELEVSIALNGETDHFVVSPTGSDYVNPGVDPFVDIYHLMTYDASYSNHNAVNSAWPLNHSPLIHAQEAVRDFASPPFNWPKSKMCVGIPFYGKTGFNGGGGTSLYGTGINASNSAAIFNDADDLVGGYNFNACPTITNKANFAISDGLAGLVIWEGSQDRTGANSLLGCAYTALGGAANQNIETGCCAQPALGNDKVVCNTPFPITLNSNTSTAGTAVNYTWTRLPATSIGTGATLNTQSVSAVGTYVVVRTETVAGRTCTKSDTIVVTAGLPVPDLGPNRTLCGSSYNITPSNLAAFPAGTTWQWQYAGADIPGATTSTFYASTPGTYTLVATLAGCTNTSDDITISASTVTPVDACRTTAGTLVLSVTGGVGPFNWYNQDSPGGSILAGGANTATFTTPALPLPSVTDYYVEDIGSATNYFVGINAMWTGFAQPTPVPPSEIAMEFDVTSQIKIRSVDLWAWGGATYPTTFNIVIYNANNDVVYTSPNTTWAVWPGAAAQTITLDASLAIGKYRMKVVRVAGGVPAFFHHAASTFPYTGGGGKISITRQMGVGQYGPFYNWQISDFGTCKRVRVRATVSASCSAPLPVDLVSFTAKKVNQDALLEWSTSREVNSGFYYVERSINATDFYPIAQVQSAGNTNALTQYTYLDANIPSGRVYYRLVQYDLDGRYTYSNIVTVNNTKGTEVLVAPNPFSDYTTLMISGTDASVYVKLYNVEGKLISSAYYENPSEAIRVGLGLESGLYILQVSSNEFLETFKLVKE